MIECPFCGGDLLIDGEKFTCYNCFKSGDIVDFLAERDKTSHKKAEWQALKSKPNPERIRALYECNSVAAEYFSQQLNGSYFSKRNVSGKTQHLFKLGYAPSDGEELYQRLSCKFDDDTIISSGLFSENEEGLKPLFRNRVMFPIFDEKGNVVGFGGRRLSDEFKTPKYINTPESLIFHKRDVLYGLDKAVGNDTLYFVEGYMDVISLHQAGINNAVAALGTAIGEHHCTLLRDCGIKNIILTMDGDEAGIKSAMRSIPIIRKYFNVSVIKLKDAKDPDEFIKTFGVESFLSLDKQNGDAFYVRHSEDVVGAALKMLL